LAFLVVGCRGDGLWMQAANKIRRGHDPKAFHRQRNLIAELNRDF
jgi:hypothetical protein